MPPHSYAPEEFPFTPNSGAVNIYNGATVLNNDC